MPTKLRSQEEIYVRFHQVKPTDYWGFQREVLMIAMASETTARLAVDGELRIVQEMPKTPPPDPDSIRSSAHGYYMFAVEKIMDHRSLSANRSVAKLREFAWLLCRDDIMGEMDNASYPQYGAPKVLRFARLMRFEWPEVPELDNMAAGRPCYVGCDMGCGTGWG